MAEFQLQKAVSMLPDGVDAALVTSACNRQYLLQFHSSAGVLLITSEEALFLVDSRYIEKAQKQNGPNVADDASQLSLFN